MKHLPIVRMALKGDSPSGFAGSYRDGNDREWLGAFTAIPKINTAVIVQHDAESVYAVINRNVRRSGFWALLLILVAIMLSYIGTRRLTRNLRQVTEVTQMISQGNFNSVLSVNSRDEVGVLAVAVNHMARQIKELLNIKVEQARVEKELETARMVQSTFFPKMNEWQGDLSVFAHYAPASECGGDWWGHFATEDGIEYVMIADAMGHGVPAALVTAMAYSSFMTMSEILKHREAHRDSPALVMQRFNSILCMAAEGKVSMTFFICAFDKIRGEARYANCGHNFPFLLPTSSNDDRIVQKPGKASLGKFSTRAITLNLKGLPLGLDPQLKVEEKSIPLKAGDKFFFYTDGFVDCLDPAGRHYGRKTLLTQLLKHAGEEPPNIKELLIQHNKDFLNGFRHTDDMTFVLVEISKKLSFSKKNSEVREEEPVVLDIGA